VRRNHYLILGFGLLLLILGLVAVVGEGGGLREREVVFWGEGDKWSAQIKEEWTRVAAGGREAGRTRVRRVFCYKGDDPESIGEVEYYLTGEKGTGSGIYKPDEEGKIVLPVIEGSFAAAEKTDTWTLVLRWDEGEEVINLEAR
jgi:hypothetical protein